MAGRKSSAAPGLYLRGGVWWLAFTPYPGAERERLSLGTRDATEAVQMATEVRKRYASSDGAKAASISKDIERWMKDGSQRQLAASTLRFRSVMMQMLIRDTGVSTSAALTPSVLERWYLSIHAKAPASANAYLTSIHTFLQFLVDLGKLPSNAARKVKRPRGRAVARRNFLTADQVRKLLENCKSNQLKFCIYCATHQGMRRGEVVQARPGWFDLQAGLVHIQPSADWQPKDRTSRTIPLTYEFRDWLKNVYGLPSPFMIFPEKNNPGEYRCYFHTAFRRLIKKLGITCSFHDLRRTFASLHVSRGTSIYKVAKWLGDGVAVVETNYAHLIPNDDEINAAWD